MTNYIDWKILKTKLNKKQEEYVDVAEWCNKTGEYHIEDYGEYYKVVENPEPLPPTYEEQSQKRAEAYRIEKDPITCQIQSLRDEEQTPEVIAEIEELKQQREKVVADIQERYPYPEEQ